MAERYLVEFIAKWIRSEELRKKVLFRERTELEKYGLDAYQQDDLLLLDMDQVMKRLRSELEDDLKIDLAAVLRDIDDTGGLYSSGGGFSAGMLYEEGNPHVRGLEPAEIPGGMDSIVIVRGHGWDHTLKVFFESEDGSLVRADLLHLDSDIDVWQRATVRVNLDSGTWRAVARIKVEDQNGNQTPVDSVEEVFVEAA